jgi:NAD(P)-dependent dehydrogenase (short-subunit alcohol dehydrogenase family)
MATKTQLISFISGSNTGIGLAVATALARDHGHHVIIGSRNSSAGAEAAKSITDKGYSASSVKLDLASDEDIATAVKYVEENFGRLDVLINNA